jgi:hypothetical protein
MRNLIYEPGPGDRGRLNFEEIGDYLYDGVYIADGKGKTLYVNNITKGVSDISFSHHSHKINATDRAPCKGAVLSSGCETRPATTAPAGSNRSNRGGDEAVEAFGVEGL